jgi:tetratricopeptide (TPR) repeat protein
VNRRQAAALALALAATAVAYHGVLTAGFVYDDLALVKTNPSIRSLSHAGEWFSRSFWRDVYNPADADNIPYYRPVVTLTLAMGYAISGLDAWGYHALNLGLHLVNVALVFVFALRFGGTASAAVAALAFGLLPVHTENVAWISGVSDVVATALGLTGSLLLVRATESPHRRALAAAGGFAAILLSFLAKESALTLPVAMLGVFLLTTDGVKLRALWPWLAVPAAGAVYMACRVAVFGPAAGFDLVQTHLALPEWRLRSLRYELLSSYTGSFVQPFDLNAFRVLRVDLTPESPEIARAWWTALTFAAVFFAAGLASLRWRAARAPFAFLVFIVLLTLPQMARPQSLGHFVFADRYLYVPSLGFCWLLGTLHGLAARVSSLTAAAAFAVLLCAFGWRTTDRVPAWRDEFALFAQSEKDSPDCATVLCALGRIHLERYQQKGDRQDLDVARAKFAAIVDKRLRERVFVSNQDLLQAYLGLAGIHMLEGRPEAALSVYEQAIERYPRSEDAHMLAGVALAQVGNTGRAEDELLKALELRPKFSQAHYNLGNLYLIRGELARAAASLRMALDIDPEFVEARLALATALVNDGKPDEAASVLRWVVEKRPDHPAIPKVRSFLESLKK